MRRHIAFMILACSTLALGGCQVVGAGVVTPMIIQQKHVNLLNASYAAADSLSMQSAKTFSKNRPLYISNLQEILDKNQNVEIANPKIGPVLAGQMRTRFLQLGHNVADMQGYAGGTSNAGEVTGTYEIANSTMNVVLRLTDRTSGRVLSTYTYSLPVTYDIKKYMTGNANMLPPLF